MSSNQKRDFEISNEEKLDMILNSVKLLDSNVKNLSNSVDILKNEHNELKIKLDDRIRQVCAEMIQERIML